MLLLFINKRSVSGSRFISRLIFNIKRMRIIFSYCIFQRSLRSNDKIYIFSPLLCSLNKYILYARKLNISTSIFQIV